LTPPPPSPGPGRPPTEPSEGSWGGLARGLPS